jgi:hypothetical protein
LGPNDIDAEEVLAMTDPFIAVTIGETSRVKVSRWDTPTGRSLVCISPEHQDRWGDWHLSHSSVSIPPASAAEVAKAITITAAGIDGAPEDPMPTAEDRELSRRP